MPQLLRLDGPTPRLGWFHRYPARFAPEVALSMLSGIALRLGGLPSTILDPFAGTFTTAAVARRLGISSIGVELTRLGLLVGQVRLSPPAQPNDVVETITDWTSLPMDRKPRVPTELRTWLGHRNSRALTTYLRLLEELDDERQRRFVVLALSASLRASSTWLPGSIKAQVDPTRRPADLPTSFRRAARSLARDCELEEGPDNAGEVSLILADARHLPLADASIDAVLTSPPYFITYDYFDVQRLTYLAFGWHAQRENQIGRKYGIEEDGVGFKPPTSLRSWYEVRFGAETTVLGRSLREYATGMRQHVREAIRVLRPSGAIAYAVANSIRLEQPFPLVDATKEILREGGFVQVEAVQRKQSGRRILPSTRDPRTGRFGGGREASVAEYIIYGRRP